MAEYTPLDLLVAGLLSHGFRELQIADAGWRRFDKSGRECRWLRESDLALVIGGDLKRFDERPNALWLWIPVSTRGIVSDQHALLTKCGAIYLRTRERAEYQRAEARKPRQRALRLDADELLDQMGGLDG